MRYRIIDIEVGERMSNFIKTAIIIAGGEGSRLWPLTEGNPKAMVEVNKKPLIYYDIQWLKSYGIEHIVIGVAYHKEKIIDYIKENDNFGVKIDISEHTVNGGTAEAFNLAISRFVRDENFVGMNCDELTNMNLSNMIAQHEAEKPLLTMALAPFYCRFSVVQFGEGSSKISGFQYGKKLQSVPVSIGIYAFNKAILPHIPKTGSIENTTFASLASIGMATGYMLDDNENWISINTMKDIKEAEAEIGKWSLKG